MNLLLSSKQLKRLYIYITGFGVKFLISYRCFPRLTPSSGLTEAWTGLMRETFAPDVASLTAADGTPVNETFINTLLDPSSNEPSPVRIGV